MSLAAPKGMTLIEVLVTLVVMAVLSVLSFQALQQLTTGKESLLRSAWEQRRLALAFAQMEQDLLPLNRMQPNERVMGLTLTESELQTPRALWRWGTQGMERRSGDDAQPVQFLSGAVLLRAEYVGVGGNAAARAAIAPGVANPRALEITLEANGRWMTRLFYIGPLE